MIGELLKAIKTRWAAKGLGSTFTGGIVDGPPIPGTTWPMVFCDVVGSAMTGRASSTTDNKFQQFETATVDFTIRAKTGLAAMSTLAEALKTAFDNASMALGSSVTLLRFWYQGESHAADPDHPNVWDWTVTYKAEMEQSKTLVGA